MKEFMRNDGMLTVWSSYLRRFKQEKRRGAKRKAKERDNNNKRTWQWCISVMLTKEAMKGIVGESNEQRPPISSGNWRPTQREPLLNETFSLCLSLSLCRLSLSSWNSFYVGVEDTNKYVPCLSASSAFIFEFLRNPFSVHHQESSISMNCISVCGNRVRCYGFNTNWIE